MPGAICKAAIDSGRARAAAAYYAEMVTATETMIVDGIKRGVLQPDDPRVIEVNRKLCYWAEEQEAWNAELFKLASDIAALPGDTKKG